MGRSSARIEAGTALDPMSPTSARPVASIEKIRYERSPEQPSTPRSARRKVARRFGGRDRCVASNLAARRITLSRISTTMAHCRSCRWNAREPAGSGGTAGPDSA